MLVNVLTVTIELCMWGCLLVHKLLGPHIKVLLHMHCETIIVHSLSCQLGCVQWLFQELELPFKISGLAANPFLYNVTKVIILSAFSAVLTELVGFKLKLYKIKIR